MKYEDIETFLTILDTGSIMKAADKLYIGQGTASTRIKQLEEELKVELFYRQKGHRKISLTAEGEEFLPIAQQWLALWQDAIHLKDLQRYRELRISATDTIHLYTFKQLYIDFSSQHNDIVLTLKTQHSSEIYRQLDNQLCDIGFCSNLYNYPNIISQPIYEEEMVLLYHKKHPFHKTHRIKDLHSEYEIYLPISNQFILWHNQYFSEVGRKLITVGTVAMQTIFFNTIENWTILPLSSAKDYIKNNPDYVYSKLKNPPPKRVIYLLTYKYPKPGIKLATQIFIDELLTYIDKNESIQVIYKQPQ